MKSKRITLLLLATIVLLSVAIPPPEGLTREAWILAGIYFAAIVGLVSKPYPEPVVMLSAVALSCFVVAEFDDSPIGSLDVLSGYASGTTWLVFSAFTLSAAFVTTGLGKRLAYWFILKFGSTTLRLGYVTALLDLLLSPATPSNTAARAAWCSPLSTASRWCWGPRPTRRPAKRDAT
ncbi:anion permease [Pantoea tagorei]